MNFAVVNLGCKVNRVESDAAAAQLLAADERLHIFDARPLGPVHAVDGPQHDVRPFGLGYRHSVGVKISVRRPDVARMHAEFPQ